MYVYTYIYINAVSTTPPLLSWRLRLPPILAYASPSNPYIFVYIYI